MSGLSEADMEVLDRITSMPGCTERHRHTWESILNPIPKKDFHLNSAQLDELFRCIDEKARVAYGHMKEALSESAMDKETLLDYMESKDFSQRTSRYMIWRANQEGIIEEREMGDETYYFLKGKIYSDVKT